MRGRPGGHRSGAGSGGAGSGKCTEVADGKHNTKIDKILQHELNDATECKNCEQRKAPGDKGAGPSPDQQAPKYEESGEDPEEIEEDDESEEEEEEGAEVAEGEGDTKKKEQTH